MIVSRNGAIAPRPLTLSNGVSRRYQLPSKDMAMKAWLYPPVPCTDGGKPRDGAPGGLAWPHRQKNRCFPDWRRRLMGPDASLILSMLAKERKKRK